MADLTTNDNDQTIFSGQRQIAAMLGLPLRTFQRMKAEGSLLPAIEPSVEGSKKRDRISGSQLSRLKAKLDLNPLAAVKMAIRAAKTEIDALDYDAITEVERLQLVRGLWDLHESVTDTLREISGGGPT
jgi:hypothetical protein